MWTTAQPQPQAPPHTPRSTLSSLPPQVVYCRCGWTGDPLGGRLPLDVLPWLALLWESTVVAHDGGALIREQFASKATHGVATTSMKSRRCACATLTAAKSRGHQFPPSQWKMCSVLKAAPPLHRQPYCIIGSLSGCAGIDRVRHDHFATTVSLIPGDTMCDRTERLLTGKVMRRVGHQTP